MMVTSFCFFGAIFLVAALLGFFRGRGVAKRGRSLHWAFYVWPFAGALVLAIVMTSALTGPPREEVGYAPLNFLSYVLAYFAFASGFMAIPYVGAAISGFYLARRTIDEEG